MYLVDWDMTPVRIPEQLSALTLSWKIPAEYSRYVFKQNYNDGLEVWKNDRIEREFNPVQNVCNNLLWTSGLEKGLAWHPKSNANWANHPGEKNIILIRDAGNFEGLDGRYFRIAVQGREADDRLLAAIQEWIFSEWA